MVCGGGGTTIKERRLIVHETYTLLNKHTNIWEVEPLAIILGWKLGCCGAGGCRTYDEACRPNKTESEGNL